MQSLQFSANGSLEITNDNFTLVYKMFYQQLLNKAFSIIKNQDEAKDVIQSTFAVLYQNRDKTQFTNLGHLRRYLYICVKNKCLNILTRSKSFIELCTIQPSEEVDISYIPTVSFNQQQIIEYKIVKAFESLSPKKRDVMLLYYFNKQKLKQISKILRIEISSVKTHKKLGTKQIRNTLKRVLNN